MLGARLPLVLVLAFAAAMPAAAPELPAGLVGLVTPAQVPDGPPGCVRVDSTKRLPIRAAPSLAAPRVGWLAFAPWREDSGQCDAVLPLFQAAGKAGRDPVPGWESDYEALALAVLERDGDWLRLDLGAVSGWLRRPPGYRFEPYPAILMGKLAYATAAWRGELCAAPSTGCRVLETTEGQPLTVLSVGLAGETGWLEVELTGDPCRSDEPETTVLRRGWIRASTDSLPTAWFHSRGC